MAWNTKYHIPYKGYNIEGNIYIQIDGYTGSTINLKLLKNSLNIKYSFDGYNDPIIKSSCSFTIINDSNNFFSYIDLFELEEGKLKVIIDATINSVQKNIFNGFISSEIIEQIYMHNSNITLNGTNFIAKLDNKYPTIFDTITYANYYQILNDTLLLTGKNDEIRVNNTLLPTTVTRNSSNNLFTYIGLDTETFWENNIDRTNGLDVIKNILTPIDSYLYWYNDNWYVERYNDVWNIWDVQTVTYSRFEQSNKNYYNVFNATIKNTINETRITKNINDLVFIDRSQTITAIPGYNKISVDLNMQPYLNLIINDFTNCEDVTVADLSGYTIEDVAPDYRRWKSYNGDAVYYNEKGKSYYTITNSVRKNEIEYTYPANVYNNNQWDLGLYTKFRCTIETGDTSLSLKWKTYFNSPTIATNLENTEIYYHYILYNVDTQKVVKYDPSTREFSLQDWNHSSRNSNVSYVKYSANSCYDDGNNIFKEVHVSVPLNEIDGLNVGNNTFIFAICPIGHRVYGTDYWQSPRYSRFGDVVITCQGPLPNNLIEGQLTTNTYNKYDISLNVCDIPSLNYRNGITLYDAINDNYIRNDSWSAPYGEGDSSYVLAEYLIYNKFKLFNKNRRKIIGRVFYNGFLRPFDRFKDTNENNKKYILCGYNYNVISNLYDVELYEFDISDEIIFN